jgi:hypothetical protein
MNIAFKLAISLWLVCAWLTATVFMAASLGNASDVEFKYFVRTATLSGHAALIATVVGVWL